MLQSLQLHFEKTVDIHARPALLSCSCPAHGLHAQCERTSFLRSLTLQHMPLPRLMLGEVPLTRKRGGRKPKPAMSEPPRKQRRTR